MENSIYTKWAEIFKAIGHPVRIKIIEALLENDKCVNHIWSALDLPQATVSQHLSLLRMKGIVQHQRCGSRVKYSITDDYVEDLMRLVRSRKLT